MALLKLFISFSEYSLFSNKFSGILVSVGHEDVSSTPSRCISI
jgi:hypothetical protein